MTDHKVLEICEAPAAAIIMDTLGHLEVATLGNQHPRLEATPGTEVGPGSDFRRLRKHVPHIIPCATPLSLPPWMPQVEAWTMRWITRVTCPVSLWHEFFDISAMETNGNKLKDNSHFFSLGGFEV